MSVKQAFIEEYGVIDEARSSILSRTQWQDIRSRINRKDHSPSAFCLGCSDPVFVKAAKSKKRTPHFSHFNNGGKNCPWGQDKTNSLDNIRANIYGGNQESELHRKMCELVVELISNDSRYVTDSGAVNKYSKPSNEGRGRWPDASFELTGLGRFAIEVQFAPSLAPEVAGRSAFYQKEEIKLIWLLPWYSFEQVERAFAADIAHEALGNFFVLDSSAEIASRRANTLKIWAAWRIDTGIHKELISLDELIYPEKGHPFYKDVVTDSIFKAAQERRSIISSHLWSIKGYTFPRPKIVFDQIEQPDYDGERLIQIAFAIWTSATGDFVNYSNEQPNLTSAINAYLNSQDGKKRAKLVYQFLVSTRAISQVNERCLNNAKNLALSETLNLSDHRVQYVRSLFPEVFQQDLRLRAIGQSTLDAWAVPPQDRRA